MTYGPRVSMRSYASLSHETIKTVTHYGGAGCICTDLFCTSVDRALMSPIMAELFDNFEVPQNLIEKK